MLTVQCACSSQRRYKNGNMPTSYHVVIVCLESRN